MIDRSRPAGLSDQAERFFAAIAKAATEVSGGDLCGAFLLSEGRLHFVAAYNFTPEAIAAYRADYPIAATRSSLVARAILDRTVVNLEDITRESDFYSRAGRSQLSYRAVLITPICTESKGFAAFGVGRLAPTRFDDDTVLRMRALSDVAGVGLSALGCA